MNRRDSGDAGTKNRQFYLTQAYINAFGNDNEDAWNPDNGFAANRAQIVQLYDYYKNTYLQQPDMFLWAGLGRMAGGAVVGGLDTIVSTSSESFLTQTLVRVGKIIFEDLAWQHEAFLDDPQIAIALASQHDIDDPARRSYGDAWRGIASGDSARIANGNLALLENEQFTIVQPYYDAIRTSNEPGVLGTFRYTSAFTNKIHPYHRDFIIVLPQGDVTVFNDRWAWITETDGMWAKWVIMPSVAPQERTRLVTLLFSDIINQFWGSDVQALLPTGASDEG